MQEFPKNCNIEKMNKQEVPWQKSILVIIMTMPFRYYRKGWMHQFENVQGCISDRPPAGNGIHMVRGSRRSMKPCLALDHKSMSVNKDGSLSVEDQGRGIYDWDACYGV